VATAAVMRASHRAARVTAAPAAALRSLSREVRDNVTRNSSVGGKVWALNAGPRAYCLLLSWQLLFTRGGPFPSLYLSLFSRSRALGLCSSRCLCSSRR